MVRKVKPRATFRMSKRTVGRPGTVYVIAEAGSNHDGKIEKARQLIDVAATAGADAVKFQLFHADRLYPKIDARVSYLKDRSIYDVIRSLEMPESWLPGLKSYAESKGLDFLCTPFDVESVDTLEDLGVVGYKMASYCLTHVPLLRRVAKTRRPVVISTGLGTMEETKEALNVLGKNGDPPVAILHCIASYPAPLDQMNLRYVATLRETFGVPVGLSDHSLDPVVAPSAAVALGATVLEKHYTLSRRDEGPDHKYALEPHELAALVRNARATASALGDGVRRIEPAERELHGFARTWLYTTRPVAKGESFSAQNVAVLRSGGLPPGLHPREYDRVLGRRAKRALAAFSPLRRSDL